MNIEFLATVAVIAPDPINSRMFYIEALGLPLHGEGDGYHHSEQIAGCKSFGIWPLSQAAQACFGADHWPAELPVPQVTRGRDHRHLLHACAARLTPARRIQQFDRIQGAPYRFFGANKSRFEEPSPPAP